MTEDAGQSRRGCDLGLFVVVNKYLARRWRGRVVEEQGVNDILDLLGQVEEKFKALPTARRRSQKRKEDAA